MPLPTMGVADRLAISPDGKLMAYDSHTARDGIAIASLSNGDVLKYFEKLEAYRGLARFTPDSQAIIYIVNGNTVGNLWRQSLDGSRPQQVTHFTEGLIVNFALSADGHQLAVARSQHYNDVILITDFK